MWDRQTVELGMVKENTSIGFSFFHTGVVSQMQLNPSCGCTQVKWIENGNIISGTVNVGRFPAHLKQGGMKQFTFLKTITASYVEDGKRKSDVLIIKATLV